MDSNLDKELDEIKGLIDTTYPARNLKEQKDRTKSTSNRENQTQPKHMQAKSRSCRNDKRKKTGVKRYVILVGVAIAAVFIFVLLLKGCGSADVLQGTWDMDGTTIYQFDGNGQGAMVLPSNTYTFKYAINEKAKSVSIDFDSERATDCTYVYDISGDKLVLTGSIGDGSFSYELSRVAD